MESVQGQPPTAQPDRSTARQLLVQYFDEEELRSLAFDLEVDYDSLRGEGKAGKARELVAFLERHGRLSELAEIGRELRSDVPWEGVVAAGEEAHAPSWAAPTERAHSVPSEGEISSQVATGDRSVQIGSIHGGVVTVNVAEDRPQVRPRADRGVLDAILAELKVTVVGGAPADRRDAALERLEEFNEALAAQEPDLATIEYVQGWFTRQLPDLGAAVSAILAHPAVVGWIESRGGEVAVEFRRRFGR